MDLSENVVHYIMETDMLIRAGTRIIPSAVRCLYAVILSSYGYPIGIVNKITYDIATKERVIIGSDASVKYIADGSVPGDILIDQNEAAN
jgi:hypothetical protein